MQTTQRKTGVGTAPYMAPETLKGGDVDARADVYSLGFVLWQMLGGRHPFPDALADTQEMVRRQLYVMPERLSAVAELPTYVDDFMAHAIAKDPNQRFLTMSQMARGMMTMREQIAEDAARGLVRWEISAGEPRFDGDGYRRQAYIAPRPVTPTDPEPTHPENRVLVNTQKRPHGLGGTIPLGEPDRSATNPQWPPAAASPSAPSRTTPAQTAKPVAPSPAVSPQPARAEHATPPGGVRDTAQAVMRPAPQEESPVALPARSRRRLVVVALISALMASASVIAWHRTPRASARPPMVEVPPVTTSAVPAVTVQPAAAQPSTTPQPSVTAESATIAPQAPSAHATATATASATGTATAPAPPTSASARSSPPSRATPQRPPVQPAPAQTTQAPASAPAARNRVFDTEP